MRRSVEMAERIASTSVGTPGGSLRVFGDWFGRPFDNYHCVVGASVARESDLLIVEFDQGETLRVWQPKKLRFEHGGFAIGTARKVRWEWFYYGRPQSPENRMFIEHSRQRQSVAFETSNDAGRAHHAPSIAMPAVELIGSDWVGKQLRDRPRPSE